LFIPVTKLNENEIVVIVSW